MEDLGRAYQDSMAYDTRKAVADLKVRLERLETLVIAISAYVGQQNGLDVSKLSEFLKEIE